MCTQCKECFYGSNCLLIERDIWFSWYKEPSSNSCLENTSADNTVSWLVNKNWCWFGLDVLVWMTPRTRGWHSGLMGKHASGPPLRPVSDRFMMNIGHDCPITGVWALFLCSCLLIMVRNKGIPAVQQLAWSMQHGAVVYQLCMCDRRCQRINILYTKRQIINILSQEFMNCWWHN